MEITLYDKNGNPIAYIADDNETVYLWDGRAVAYINGDLVYGFNGTHLGWFIREVIYDKQGRKIGFIDKTCSLVKSVKPVKSVKHVKSVKSGRSIANIRPVLSIGYSNDSLESFLERGK